jgi:hypothetical protein
VLLVLKIRLVWRAVVKMDAQRTQWWSECLGWLAVVPSMLVLLITYVRHIGQCWVHQLVNTSWISLHVQIVVLWVLTPCTLMGWHRHFRGTCCLHFQDLYMFGEDLVYVRILCRKWSLRPVGERKEMEPFRASRFQQVVIICVQLF